MKLAGWLRDAYASIFDEEALMDHFARLADHFKSHVVALHLEIPLAQEILLAHGASEDFLSKYGDYENLWVERGFSHLMREGVVNADAHTAPSEIRKTAYYADLLRPMDIEHSIGAIAWRGGRSEFALLSISRSQRVGGYDAEDLARLKALQPDLQNIIGLFLQARTLQGQVATLQSLFDASSVPIMALDANGIVRYRNAAADLAVREESPLGLAAGGRLRLQHPRSMSDLRLALKELSELSGERYLVIFHPDGRRWGSGHLRKLAEHFDMGGPVPLFLLSFQPFRQVMNGQAALESIFDLTPAQARLAISLAETFDLADSAESMGITRETARSHLKQCFAKTETNSQVELVALVRAVQ